ncbi:MAG TPA: site-specific integrase [Acidimicrobiales bacterium]|nr:site-specific integrase [Acidimicrobiales bacterium]
MAHVRRASNAKGWQARYRDPSGRERSRSFPTKREAELFLVRQSADIQRGEYLDPRLGRTTVGELVEEWLATAVHLKPKTRLGYESILPNRILPRFGAVPVASINQLEVRRFVAGLVQAGAEPGTVRNTFNVLRLVFGLAVGAGAIRVNPCDGVRMPRSVHQEMLFLTPAELLRLADAIRAQYRTLVLFAGYTGLRAGEIGALRAGRIDLGRGTAEVRESLAEVNGRLVFGPTKTYANRTVRLPRFLCEEMAVHLSGRCHQPDALVFTSPAGAALRHNLFYVRHFKPAVAAAGLSPRLRFHDLRHSCAAILIAQGAHPRAIMERLGHSTIQVTLDRYGHLFPGLDETLTDGLERAYQDSRLAEFDR